MISAIGNPVYDYIKTPRVDTKERILSGCSTNAALVLAKLGVPVRLVGAVGDDFKSQFVADLKKFGIEPEIHPSPETGGFSLVYYDAFGNRTLDLLGRAANIERLNMDSLRESEAVLIGPILGEVSFDAIRDIRAHYSGLFFCDPQGLLRNADETGRIYHEKKPGIEGALRQFDIVKPNELEGKVLTGIDCRKDPYEAARIIKSWGPKIVIVTLAELGSVIYDGTQFIDIPPYEVDLIDATGAGDTYMAGFTFEYLKTGGDLKKAGCFASATSSIMIENVGPGFVMTEAMIRERQQKLLRMPDFKPAVAVNS
ncbi:ribokinase [candidate division GN15 bacterium]|uniref:Ribokinase n=1 Tax=candidate division GN15 bacterium TaxID=2072418 RepID=A0A855X5L1_9BACT|nr:MAG: ribokinase [candidate division GN15 bacterium]